MKKSKTQWTLAILLTELMIIAMHQLLSTTTSAQSNNPPELGTPTSTRRYVVFPRAAGALLEFAGEPATSWP